MKTADNISEFTIYRLSIYKRCLEQLEREHLKTVSSKEFAFRFGLNSAQVRKDLAFFGEFGIRGMGYQITMLKEQLMMILGLTETGNTVKTWKAALVGAGKIGVAFLKSPEFAAAHFDLVAAFDDAPDTCEFARQRAAGLFEPSVPLFPMTQLEDIIESTRPDMAILTVTEASAQDVANRLVNAGMKALLNFVPIQLIVPANVKVRTVDLIAELQCLAYHLRSEALHQEFQPQTE